MIRILFATVITGLAAATAFAQDHQHDATASAPAATVISEPGQATFGAISEIVARLEATPGTDWSRVDVDALRDHLVDMDNVFIRATSRTIPVDRGARFEVTSFDPAVERSIRVMARAHARMVRGSGGREVGVAEIPGGAVLTVTGDDEARIRALGFFGLLTDGSHHQRHHLMMASGELRH